MGKISLVCTLIKDDLIAEEKLRRNDFLGKKGRRDKVALGKNAGRLDRTLVQNDECCDLFCYYKYAGIDSFILRVVSKGMMPYGKLRASLENWGFRLASITVQFRVLRPHALL